MSIFSRLCKPVARRLPYAPCWVNGRLFWFPGSLWGSFRLTYELPLAHFFDQELQSAVAFIDVGANIGLWTVWAMKVNPELRAIAVEPSRAAIQLRRLLKANVDTERIEIVEKCVSDDPGPIHFYDNGGGTSGVSKEWTESFVDEHHVQSYDVATIKLEDLLAKVRQEISPDGHIVCKVDIEGHEERVFAASSAVRDSNTTFVVEVHHVSDIASSSVYRCAVEAGRRVEILGPLWKGHITIAF